MSIFGLRGGVNQHQICFISRGLSPEGCQENGGVPAWV